MSDGIFEASVKRSLLYALIVLVICFILMEMALANRLNKIATLETIIGILGAYGIYVIVAYSNYLLKLVSTKYRRLYRHTRKYQICRGIIKVLISTAILILLMLLFVFTPILTSWLANIIGVRVSELPIGIIDEIYGALVGGWAFDLFGQIVKWWK